MGAWLDRLKIQKGPDTYATETTETPTEPGAGVFVGFVAYPPAPFQIIEGVSEAVNDTPQTAEPQAPVSATTAPAPDPDRWAWPHSDAWNTGEIELFNRRAALFARRGAGDVQAEVMAGRLVRRDREEDDRHICHECRHLRGGLPGWLCGNGAAAGMPIRGWGAGLPAQLVAQLQRCTGFAAAGLPATAPTFVAAPAPAPAPVPAPAPAPAMQASPMNSGHVAGAPPAQLSTGPNFTQAAPWRELDRAYLAHHAQCVQCQGAGRGYGARCDGGMGLWAAYSKAST